MSTGGEGGMVTTNSKTLWSRMWSYKDHGKSWETVYEKDHPPGFRWLHESFGTNWRMTEMQAAVGRIQLARMPAWHKARANNALKILNAAKSSEVFRVPEMPHEIEHGWYKCYAFIKSECLAEGWTRDSVIAAINALGVPCFSGSCSEVYLEKCFVDAGIGPQERLHAARELGETSVMFMVHPTLTSQNIQDTCDAIAQVAVECLIK